MKDKKEILLALANGETLVYKYGGIITIDNFNEWTYKYPEDWSIKKRKVKKKISELFYSGLAIYKIYEQIKDQHVEIDE